MIRTELVRPLPELLRAHAERLGHKPAFRDSRREVSYVDLESRTRRVAGHLVGLGLQPGDHAAICMGNSVDAVEACLAVNRAGAVAVPLNPLASLPELAYFLDDSAARVAIVDAARLDLLAGLLAERPALHVIVSDDPDRDAAESLPALAVTEPATPARDDLGLDEVSWLLYTSGTTGRNKGVRCTQRGFLWSAAACAPALGLSEQDTVLWPLPLHHTMGHAMCVVGVTALGATARILDGLDVTEILAWLDREPYTFLGGVPTTYHQLIRAARERGFRPPPHLRACLVSGAGSGQALISTFESVFGVPLLDGYGSTETCGPVTTNWVAGTRVDGSCGLPLPGLTVRLVDPATGTDVPTGDEGEVWVSGPNLMVGYHNQPEATAAVLRDGWYRTGDLARRDETGFLTIAGRLKELIIRGGENIHPGEIEEVLRSLPDVVDAGVAGRPHETLGEVPVAFVVPRPGPIDARALLAACRQQLSYAKVPVEFYAVTRVPRTATGKVQRAALLQVPAALLDTGEDARAAAGAAGAAAGAAGAAAGAAGAAAGAADLPDPAQLRERLAAGTRPERLRMLTDLVEQATGRLCPAPDGIVAAARRTFADLGLDSVSAVALRDQLAAETGLRLPATVAFDHPTPASLARLLYQRMFGAEPARPPAAPAFAPAAPEQPIGHEPIAIVSMACRFPGGIESPADLWRLVAAGGEAVSDFPTDRHWDLDALYHPDPAHPSTSYARHGGFLRDVAGFDAAFFGIGPREAEAMDPQQRLLLEIAWEAAERAGIDPLSLRGSETGVFVGLLNHDYAPPPDRAPAAAQGLLATGNAGSVASGRIAYTLGLHGPALTVDTACSSSLVALHLAVQSLRRGECALVLAGGATVMATPAAFVEFSRQRGLAPDGRCKPFGAAADGVGWAEGAGLVLLERLSDARRDGHPVLAVIRGSAVNQDGSSNGLTAPNGLAQQRVIRRALADAGLAPADVDVVEAHGTGTRLGDPIEAEAVLATYGQDRPPGRELWLGSVKSNIGHTQAAAGIAGVIKMVTAIRHGVAPRTLHADPPSTEVDWSAGSVRLLTEARDWPAGSRPRRAAVSAFGISGTNAHVILEQVPAAVAPPSSPAAAAPPQGNPAAPGAISWLLAARTPTGLRAQARRLLPLVEQGQSPVEPLHIAHSLATCRAALDYRAAVVGRDIAALRGGVAALAGGMDSPALLCGVAAEGGLAVWFPGQGSQYAGMGRELYARHRKYAEAFDAACARLDERLAGQVESSVRDAVLGEPEPGLLDRTVYAQAGLFAVEVALYRLLESWGLRPDFVAGHSIGELVAAHVAGVLDLADAARLVAARGLLMQAQPAGAMVAVEATEQEALARLVGASGVAIAAVNGPRSLVLSGETEATLAVVAAFAGDGRRTRRLRVSHAFHSPLLDGMLEPLSAVAKGLAPRPPEIPVGSNLTGELATAAELADPGYWARQARGTVRFADGVRCLERAGARTFLEVGPGGTLSALARATLSTADTAGLVPALRPRRAEDEALTEALARLYVRGVRLDWAAVYAGTRAVRVDLPTYPFQRQRYWLPRSGGPAAPPPSTQGASAHDHDRAGALRALPAAQRLAALEELVRGEVARVLGHATADAVAADQPLADAGLSSLTAAELRDRLAATVATDLALTAVFDHPTPARLARHLDECLTGPPRASKAGVAGSWLRCPAPRPRAAVRLICLPHAGGSASFFRNWPAQLPDTLELVTVQYPGREDRNAEPPVTDLHELADLVTEQVIGADPRRFALFGHSMGAALAREVALRCQRLGRAATRLFASGYPAGGYVEAGTAHLADDDGLLATLRGLGGVPDAVARIPVLRAMLLTAARADLRAIETYHPGPDVLDCPVVAYVGRTDPAVSREEAAGWQRLTRSGFTLRTFPGGHFYLMAQERELTRDLAGHLHAAALVETPA
jgi:rifamycin polyketide synthase module 1/2/3